MTFLNFPLGFLPWPLDCTCTVHVLENIALLHLIEPEEHRDAIGKEHDLRRVVAGRHCGRIRLLWRRRASRPMRKREVLRDECGRLRRLHGQPAVARLSVYFAIRWLTADSWRRVARDVSVITPEREALFGRAARDEVRAGVAVLLRLGHA